MGEELSPTPGDPTRGPADFPSGAALYELDVKVELTAVGFGTVLSLKVESLYSLPLVARKRKRRETKNGSPDSEACPSDSSSDESGMFATRGGQDSDIESASDSGDSAVWCAEPGCEGGDGESDGYEIPEQAEDACASGSAVHEDSAEGMPAEDVPRLRPGTHTVWGNGYFTLCRNLGLPQRCRSARKLK
jgi:hypothetical protein